MISLEKRQGTYNSFALQRGIFCIARVSRHISSIKKMFWSFCHFSSGSICVEDFFKIRFRTLLFRTPSGNRFCTIKNVRNILGTISKCYVFWKPVTLLKINRTERGSHGRILANLTRSNSLTMESFFSKVYNFSPTILKKYSTAKKVFRGFSLRFFQLCKLTFFKQHLQAISCKWLSSNLLSHLLE